MTCLVLVECVDQHLNGFVHDLGAQLGHIQREVPHGQEELRRWRQVRHGFIIDQGQTLLLGNPGGLVGQRLTP